MRQIKPFTVEVRRKRRAKNHDAESLWRAPRRAAEATRACESQEGMCEDLKAEGDSEARLPRSPRD